MPRLTTDEITRLIRFSKNGDVHDWIRDFKHELELSEKPEHYLDTDIFDTTRLANYMDLVAGDIRNMYRISEQDFEQYNFSSSEIASEVDQSVNDEYRSGQVPRFSSDNMYYAFSYMPVPDGFYTDCIVDPVSNKLVLRSVKTTNNTAELENECTKGFNHTFDNNIVHTCTAFDGSHNVNVHFESDYGFNFIEFEVVPSKGSNVIVTSLESNGIQLLRHQIELTTSRKVRLYISPVMEADLTFKFTPSLFSTGSNLNILSISSKLITYVPSGYLRIKTNLEGTMYLESSYYANEASSFKANIRLAGKTVSNIDLVSGGRYEYDLVKGEFYITMQTSDTFLTPIMRYVRYGVLGDIANAIR